MSSNAKVGLMALAGLVCLMGVGVFVSVRGFRGYQELDQVGVETRGVAVAKGYRKIGGDLVPMSVHRSKFSGRASEQADYRASLSSFVVRYTYEVDGQMYGHMQDMPKSVADEHDWSDSQEVGVIVKYHPKKPNVGRIVGFVDEAGQGRETGTERLEDATTDQTSND